jgi:hypothetical protein
VTELKQHCWRRPQPHGNRIKQSKSYMAVPGLFELTGHMRAAYIYIYQSWIQQAFQYADAYKRARILGRALPKPIMAWNTWQLTHRLLCSQHTCMTTNTTPSQL